VDVTDLDADPLRQLAAWLDAARPAGQPMPEAMTIASATSDGVPSARLVVLRGLRPGLVFFTDCQSDKGAELAANPRAAAVLHWLVPAHRQVRVAGPVEPVSEDEADEYWSTRPRRPSQRGRLAAKPRRGQPDGPENAGPGHAAAPPRRSRCSPAAALGRLWGAAVPRRVLAGIAGRSARPDPLPPGRQRLDHRAAVAVTINGLSNDKATTIKPPCPSPAVTVRQARSQTLPWETLQIADYETEGRCIGTLWAGTQNIYVWAHLSGSRSRQSDSELCLSAL
jgi:Pyridoxamine 5'-phosphate oxidase